MKNNQSINEESRGLKMYLPFVALVHVGRYKTASYWTSIFGGPAVDLSAFTAKVDFVRQNHGEPYSMMKSLDDCLASEASFYFDDENQLLYVHMLHSADPLSCVLEYGTLPEMAHA
jgi:hypothetical protein